MDQLISSSESDRAVFSPLNSDVVNQIREGFKKKKKKKKVISITLVGGGGQRVSFITFFSEFFLLFQNVF